MEQLPLFNSKVTETSSMVARGPLDAESECWLETFQANRMRDGAHPRSVAREVSQLRSLAREVSNYCCGGSITLLVIEPGLVARALLKPLNPVSQSTGRSRLIAVQRFVHVISPLLGHDSVRLVQMLDGLLPAQRSVGWHTLGIVVAGSTTRRRRRGPTLETGDLHALVSAAVNCSTCGHEHRDRALVALHCWSGLRPEEIVRLRWEDLKAGRTSTDELRYAATIIRAGQEITLPILDPAINALEPLAIGLGGWIGVLTGYVFRAGRGSERPLSYRAARDILRSACHHADLPTVEATQLRAAFAYWLKSQGLSDHEVALVLGLKMVRSVDRLLTRHMQLSAQRRVREILQ